MKHKTIKSWRIIDT